MEQHVIDQIKYGLKYVPVNLAKSYFIRSSSDETRGIRSKGVICGVCHPNENYEQIKDANIGWIRIDISYPYNGDGSLSEDYLSFKERARGYAERGIKVMAVTPYPKKYIEAGVDVRLRENEKKLADTARFLLNDLRGIVYGFQITNEMGIPHFTLPMQMTQAARFIGVQLEAMYPERGDIIIGYNSAGPQADLHSLMKPYHKYCDYVGIDIYIGCFGDMRGYMWFYDAMLRYLWAFTRKPIILQEFGYISGGAPKTPEEKTKVLQSYGFNSEEEACSGIEELMTRLPRSLKEHVEHVGKGDASRYFNLIFKSDLVNHFYRELPKKTMIPGYPHTPEGQANFFKDYIPRFFSKDYNVGAIVYCYSDSERCYICGQNDCPVETRWGLVDRDGKEKPSYYAVKDAFGKIRGKK